MMVEQLAKVGQFAAGNILKFDSEGVCMMCESKVKKEN